MSNSSLLSLPFYQVRLFCFFAALSVYALFGTPTPDSLSHIEAIIGVLLMVALLPGVLSAFDFNGDRQLVERIAQVFFIYAIVLGMIMAAVQGAGLNSILRDFAALIFMMLPLFAIGVIGSAAQGRSILVYSIVFSAIAFSYRVTNGADPLAYLANSPYMLFAALYLVGIGMSQFVERFTLKSLALSLGLIALSLYCVWPMALTEQRASIGIYGAFIVLWSLILAVNAPKRAIWLIIAGLVAAYYFRVEIGGVVEEMLSKTARVGANARGAEMAAVWHAISENPLTVLFGQGFGAAFHSPAVADIKVYFTHGLVSSLLLKIGVIGAILGLGYIGVLLVNALRSTRSNIVLAVATIAPVLIDTFLYASFKSLDFGVVLLLIWVIGSSKKMHIENRVGKLVSAIELYA
ncbi:MAG: hypothetical protein KTR28_01235 [Micavibrio sp.]|nr:hypothetical protein [Micavibrio sp.]